MKSFRDSKWDSDAEDYSYPELFKGPVNKKKEMSLKGIKKQLHDLKSSNVNFITVQTKIELGKAQNRTGESSRKIFETSNQEKKFRKKCKKSRAEMSSDSSDDSEEETSKKQKKMLKKYSSELTNFNNDSDKLTKELLKEKKRQKKLQRKLEKASRKQLLLHKIVDAKIKDKLVSLDVKKIKQEPIDDVPFPKPIPNVVPNKPKMSLNDLITKRNREREKITAQREKIASERERIPAAREKITSERERIPVERERIASERTRIPIEKEKIGHINVPESLRIIKQLKLQEKLRTILNQNQIEKKEAKPVPVLTLRHKMMEKLKAARFRFLNEQIYKTDSKEAQRIFQSDPEAFIAYHEGYRQQVKSWPVNPLDVIINTIRKMPRTHVVADFGCGDAKLAKSVEQKVYSFDLVAVDKTVVACDMANVPLSDASIDVAVFCLSLMGTNLQDYLIEANRVLKLGGILKIADVESRFEKVEDFIEGLQRLGFRKSWKDLTHNLFYFMDFRKINNVRNKKKLPTISLLPCLYKKR